MSRDALLIHLESCKMDKRHWTKSGTYARPLLLKDELDWLIQLITKRRAS